jgi:hypothetical protein
MNEENKRGFFAIIPSVVLTDKNLLPIDKLILAEIYSLANEEGWCYPSNKHFAETLNISERYARERIEKIRERGYINIVFTENGFRIIFINLSIFQDNIKESFNKIKDKFLEKNENVINRVEKENFISKEEWIKKIEEGKVKKNNGNESSGGEEPKYLQVEEPGLRPLSEPGLHRELTIKELIIKENNIYSSNNLNNIDSSYLIEQKTNDGAQTNDTAQNNLTPSIENKENEKIKICKYCKLEILNKEDLFELNVDSFSHKKCYENYLKSKIEEKKLNNKDNSIDSYFERLKKKYEGSKKTKYDYENIISEEEEQKLEDEISSLERKIKNKKASPEGEEFKVWDLENY